MISLKANELELAIGNVNHPMITQLCWQCHWFPTRLPHPICDKTLETNCSLPV